LAVKVRWWLAIAASALMLRTSCGSCRHDDVRGRVRFATFNIENFPKDDRQIDGAFAEIASLDAGFVGVQEISDPELFLRSARARLGASWDFAYVDPRPLDPDAARTMTSHHLGVVFDRRAWHFAALVAHDETRLADGRNKPTLDVRLVPAGGGAPIHVLVVHFKAGGDGRVIRAQQYPALVQVVRKVQRSGERIVLMGDFNATSDDDRTDLAALAKATGLTWATEPLACSAFWSRDDGCFRSRLDHVLTWAPPSSMHAAGACATEGCAWQDSCPLYVDQISDHCPVVVEL
jgi:endonuclease/exonuclease/phosphatase family metal-dependent hydrolase